MLASNGGYGQPVMGPAPTGPAPSQQQPQSNSGGTYYAPPDGSIAAAEQYTMAERIYQQALARFNQQRQGLLSQNGYAGDINAKTGMVGNVRVDPNSLYGNLQEMLHNQALEDQNATFGAQDRNLLGGLANQAQSELAYAHHGQTTALANTLLDNLSNIDAQQMDAKNALDMALWQLQQGAANSSPNNPADPGGGVKNPGSLDHHLTQYGWGRGGRSAAQTMRSSNPGGYRSLAAWSQAMNARYGPHAQSNAYNTNKNKRG